MYLLYSNEVIFLLVRYNQSTYLSNTKFLYQIYEFSSTRIHNKMLASKALHKSWKSGSGIQGSQTDVFDKEINIKTTACGVLAGSWL